MNVHREPPARVVSGDESLNVAAAFFGGTVSGFFMGHHKENHSFWGPHVVQFGPMKIHGEAPALSATGLDAGAVLHPIQERGGRQRVTVHGKQVL